MYRNKIAITGDLGSGKSTLAKLLSKEFSFEYMSTGKVQRNIAKNMGMNTLELNIYSETHPEIDNEIDSVFTEMNNKEEGYIVDSRLAWHFIKDSFKIYLKVHPLVAAERVISDDKRTNEPDYNNDLDAMNELILRRKSEERRFFKEYGVTCSDMNNYDCIIDTSIISIKKLKKFTKKLYKKWKNKPKIHQMWVSPEMLLPTENSRLINNKTTKDIRERVAKKGFKAKHPIEVVIHNNFYFIKDGHKRTSAALFNNIPLVPVTVLAENEELVQAGQSAQFFAESSYNLSSYNDWEDRHSFRFLNYPVNEKEK